MHAPTTRPNAPEEHDLALARRLQARDPRALEDLYDQFGSLVYGMSLRYLRDVPAAEDLTQETFLCLWNRAATFDAARGSLASWVGMVARCRAIDYVRSVECRMTKNSGPLEDAEFCPDPPSAPGGLSRAEQIQMLQDPWKKLKGHERQALRLAYWAGL